MFADKLKKSLLQAAIQGQLTEQLPTDGDARDLLKKIRAEKAKLVAEKKIKAEKPLPPISDNEIPFDLPDNWCWCRLNEVIYSVGSKANQILSKEVQKTGKYPAVSQGQQFIDGYTNSDDKLIYDVPLIMFGDHTRNVKYIDFPFVISADGTKFLKPILVEPRYFYWWLVLTASLLHNRGYNRHYRLLKLELFPLPPPAEQERIVKKLDALLSQVDELAKDERELVELEETFPRRMRNSLLQAAIQGKLTEQLPSDGNARDLLKKIRAEKAKLLAEKKIKAEKTLPPVTDDEIPFNLPDNWCWCRLDDIGTFISGYTPKSNELTTQGKIPYFKVADMNTAGNEIWLTKTKLYLKNNTARIYEKNTIVYPKNGGAIFTNKKRLLQQDSVVDLNTGGYKAIESLNLMYVFNYFLTIDFRLFYKGTAVPTLDNKQLRELLFPLPPLAEQERIVERLNELLPLCEI